MPRRSVRRLFRELATSELFSHSFYQLAMAAIYIPVLITIREALLLSVPRLDRVEMLLLMCL